MDENKITIKGTGSVGPTTTCPYCGVTFGTEYYEKQHVPCPEPKGDKPIIGMGENEAIEDMLRWKSKERP